ncbi:hypothetical protein HDU86_008264 [Geranomyces michiganensis]|nr:hypothetical protein HDU86_008264 [Geranomyces michiganensis]
MYKRRTDISRQVIKGINNTTSATADVASEALEPTASPAASVARDAFASLTSATNALASVDGNASRDFEVAIVSQQQVTVEDVDDNDEDCTSDVDDPLPECAEIVEYRAKLAQMVTSPCAVVQQTARHYEILRKRWHVYNAAILGLPKSKSLEMPAKVVIGGDTDGCLAKMSGLRASRTALQGLVADGEVEMLRRWFDWPPFRTSTAAVTPEMVVMLMGALAVDATTSALSRAEATAKLLVSGVIATVVAMMAPTLQVHHEFVHEFAGTASDGSGAANSQLRPSHAAKRLACWKVLRYCGPEDIRNVEIYAVMVGGAVAEFAVVRPEVVDGQTFWIYDRRGPCFDLGNGLFSKRLLEGLRNGIFSNCGCPSSASNKRL